MNMIDPIHAFTSEPVGPHAWPGSAGLLSLTRHSHLTQPANYAANERAINCVTLAVGIEWYIKWHIEWHYVL